MRCFEVSTSTHVSISLVWPPAPDCRSGDSLSKSTYRSSVLPSGVWSYRHVQLAGVMARPSSADSPLDAPKNCVHDHILGTNIFGTPKSPALIAAVGMFLKVNCPVTKSYCGRITSGIKL